MFDFIIDTLLENTILSEADEDNKDNDKPDEDTSPDSKSSNSSDTETTSDNDANEDQKDDDKSDTDTDDTSDINEEDPSSDIDDLDMSDDTDDGDSSDKSSDDTTDTDMNDSSDESSSDKLKKINLIRRYSDIYDYINIAIRKFKIFPIQNDKEKDLIDKSIQDLTYVRSAIYDYLQNCYENNSYATNLYKYQNFAGTIRVCVEILQKIKELRQEN